MKPRIVVTGIGAVGPRSLSMGEMWDYVKAGRSAIEEIEPHIGATGIECKAAGRVPSFAHRPFPAPFKPKRLSRSSHLYLLAQEEAVQSAGLLESPPRSHCPTYVLVGVSTSDLGTIIDNEERVVARGAGHASLYAATQTAPQATAVCAAHYLQHHLPTPACGYIVRAVSCACASGLEAVGEAWNLISRGEAEIVVTGGVDAPLVPGPMASYEQGGLVSRHQKAETASRPFDRFADTGVVSEAGVSLVVESLSHARRRGANPLLEIIGYGSRFDQPGQIGQGYLETFRTAFLNSKENISDLGHVSAWAPGLPTLDQSEIRALLAIYAEAGLVSDYIPVYSIKGVIGNPFAGAGPMQVACEVMAAAYDIIPPTANLDHPHSPLLDHVVGLPRKGYNGIGLINGHGAGGGNCSVLVRKFVK